MHTSIYDAWAAYDSVAVGTSVQISCQPGSGESVKQRAISQAAYRALADQFPTEAESFKTTLTGLGFTVSSSRDASTPEGVGNLAADAVIKHFRDDGANQAGDLTSGGAIYADYTGYAAANPPIDLEKTTRFGQISNPDRWQPLIFRDGAGTERTQSFLCPHWHKVRPFALTSASQFRPPPPKELTSQGFIDQAKHLIFIQEHLSLEQKVVSDYWSDGPKSVLPPGHWEEFGCFVSARDNHTLDQDVKMFFALSNALHDAAIATWDAKRHYDYVRPVTAIRSAFRGVTLKGWNGSQITDLPGQTWRPFQTPTSPTPPFAEYTSGHSAFSMASAEVLKRFTGSDVFNHSHTQAGPIRVEPKIDASGVKLAWDTFSEAAAQAGRSRLYGGIHFYEGNLSGITLGQKVGTQVWERARSYWEGRVPAPAHGAGSAESNSISAPIASEKGKPMVCSSCSTDPRDTIVGKLQAAGNFTSLLADMARTALWAKLQSDRKYTLFAPTDYAYGYAKEGYHLAAGGLQEVAALPREGEALLQLMYSHLVPTKVPPSEVHKGREDIALDGMVLSFDMEGDITSLLSREPTAVRRLTDMFMVNLGPGHKPDGSAAHSALEYDANLTAIIEASDGIIYVLDAVLLHPHSADS
ncbi:DUF6851 domain-containing protein [Streptomyces zaomyceticus]|uniref:DUF6851 domain-containing protein n=1 Tax=Streptomyces zaomyceticus TaxID=68286 RepID=UPI00366A372F